MRRGPVSVLLAALLATQGAAQAPPPGSVKATVDVTVLTLDVLALDSKDRPVLDLLATDFEVRVAGKVQAIEGFEPPAREAAGTGESPPSPGVDRIAGTTEPLRPGAPPLHVLLYVDLEQLDLAAIVETAQAAQAYARAPEGGPRVSLVTHLGAAATRLWDETSLDRMTSELEALEADAATFATAPRGYAERQRTENQFVRYILNAEELGVQEQIGRAYAEFGAYLRQERVRVTEAIRELRAVCERFALVGDRRQAVLFSQGYERIPGMSAVQYLSSALGSLARRGPPLSRADRAASDVMGILPGNVSSRLAFNTAPLTDLDELEAFLAASGVTLHFVDPSRTTGMTTAEHGATASTRDRPGDVKAVQDGGIRLADATGGMVRLIPSGLGDALGGIGTAAAATYRLAVRLTNVTVDTRYKVAVTVKRKGVKALARRTFVAETPAAQRARSDARVEEAQAAVGRSRASEKGPGATRTAKKPIAVSAEWKGGKGPNPSAPDRPFHSLVLTIPYDDLRFVPEGDTMVSSIVVTIKAAAADSPWNETFTHDLFLDLSGAEYSAAAGKSFVKPITLAMPTGTIDLTVSVNDVLEGSFGTARLRVVAGK